MITTAATAKKIDIEKNAADFKELVSTVIHRTGIGDLMAHLESETDFFIAPASSKFHLNIEGGLVQHSLNVYDILHRNAAFRGMTDSVGEETIALTALFHDLTKANTYTRNTKWRKDKNDKWESYFGWDVNDPFPAGHGEKSVMMLQQFIKLTELEMLAIRWHMGPWEEGASKNFGLQNSFAKFPFVVLTHLADMEAANVLEETINP